MKAMELGFYEHDRGHMCPRCHQRAFCAGCNVCEKCHFVPPDVALAFQARAGGVEVLDGGKLRLCVTMHGPSTTEHPPMHCAFCGEATAHARNCPETHQAAENTAWRWNGWKP